ncbi:MAG: hypothetical protein IJ848_01745 [Alphaproteobacteria bacterium]|nr:hypothetical protein [Alphaproteobacteria bacterium]
MQHNIIETQHKQETSNTRLSSDITDTISTEETSKVLNCNFYKQENYNEQDNTDIISLKDGNNNLNNTDSFSTLKIDEEINDDKNNRNVKIEIRNLSTFSFRVDNDYNNNSMTHYNTNDIDQLFRRNRRNSLNYYSRKLYEKEHRKNKHAFSSNSNKTDNNKCLSYCCII